MKGLWEGASRWMVAAVAGVAAAVAAGTVPDVIKGWLGDQRLLLTVLCVAAAVMFAGINLWQQRSKGVGIVIALPRANWRAPWSTQWIGAATDHARRNHDSCFVVRRDVEGVGPGADADERAAAREARRDTLDLAYELVTARLTELSEADPSTPVSLYVNAALPDAFELGTRFKFNVQRELRGVSATRGERAGEAEAAIAPVLPQRSESGRSDFFTAVRISGRMKEPLSPAEAVRAARLARVVEEPEFEGAEEGRAVALVVHLSDNPMMVAQALRAASDGCADTDGRWERCRAALVVDGGPANLPEAAVDFELVVRHVYAAWQAWVAARPQYAALSPRLFIAAPASVAFALGWLLGHAMKAVPYPYETDSHEAGPRGAELSGRGTDGTGSHDADAHESGPREGGTDETGEPCTSS
ncbi:hypothetical protein OG339_24245 [Streptosporangium sp. NBC_01495]|uniref:hypothetical protein n=1 Tax=Streptosporangium sp. NBC_01495 TaxID=2903899 RepID=UPI002E36D1F9|nr:hypothetical protein [Streptosporangium sp. NBC_01495]